MLDITDTYKLGKTIANNVLNYKDVVNLIYIDEEVSCSLLTDLCDCGKPKFYDAHHKHISEELRKNHRKQKA